jgi:hypothetical protein
VLQEIVAEEIVIPLAVIAERIGAVVSGGVRVTNELFVEVAKLPAASRDKTLK